MIAASSVLTFDVYKMYWGLKATQPKLTTVTHPVGMWWWQRLSIAFGKGLVGIGMLLFIFWVKTDEVGVRAGLLILRYGPCASISSMPHCNLSVY